MFHEKKKRSSDSGIVQPDCRGTHSKTSILEDVITNAREFLSKLPVYESHYSRRDCGKKFLLPHLTISALYEEYSKEHCKDSIPISYRLFCTEFPKKTLAIKKPQISVLLVTEYH